MNRQGEEEFEYDSSSAPSTPKNSEGNGEKKKSRGLKKLFTKKKSANNLDKPASVSERGLVRDEGGGSESRRRSLPGFLKFGRSFKNDESKSSESHSYNEKTSETPLEKSKTNERDSWVEPSKEETKPKKHDSLADKIGEEATKLLEKDKEDIQKHLHKPITQATIEDKGKPKEHQESEVIANVVQEKEVVKYDLQHHHKQEEYPNDDVKEEEKSVAPESKIVTDESRDLGSPSPSPSPTPLKEKESVGCESLAQGLQNVCLPWTVKKDDH